MGAGTLIGSAAPAERAALEIGRRFPDRACARLEQIRESSRAVIVRPDGVVEATYMGGSRAFWTRVAGSGESAWYVEEKP